MARCLEFLLGVYFIAGAVPKALDIDKFIIQMSAYKVLDSQVWMFYSALATLFTEMALGTAMLVGLRLRGITLAAMQGMLIFFSCLITYAWLVHGLEDCGCFPVIKMTPQMSLFKNALTFAAGLFLLYVFHFRKAPGAGTNENVVSENAPAASCRRPLAGAAAKVLACLIVALSAVAYAWQDVDQDALTHQQQNSEAGPFAQFDLYLPEGHFDLSKGTYLAAIMSMTCDECQAKVPALNDLFLTPDVPQLVAICYEDAPGDLDLFRGLTMPMFPLYSIGDRTLLYYSFLKDDPFRLYLVKDGQALAFWDGRVPTLEEIYAAADGPAVQ